MSRSDNMLDPQQKLSEAQMVEYWEAFKLLDRDADGLITTRDLRTVMRSLEQNPTEDDLQEMIGEMDKDGNRTAKIGFDKFRDFMTQKLRQDDSELKEAFCIFPRENDAIPAAKLGSVMNKLGASVSKEEIDEMMKTHLDGIVKYDDFARVMSVKKQDGAANRGENVGVNGGPKATTKSTGGKKSTKPTCAIL